MVDRSQWGEIQSTKIHNSLLHKLEVIVLCYTWILSRAEHNTISDINLQLLNNRIFGSIYRLPILLISESIEMRGSGGPDPPPPPPKKKNIKKIIQVLKVSLGISLTTSTPHPYPTASKILDSLTLPPWKFSMKFTWNGQLEHSVKSK